jgi:hypothetical protein
MNGRPSETQLQRRIAELLMTRDAGRAVARRLQEEPRPVEASPTRPPAPAPRPFAAVSEADPREVVPCSAFVPEGPHRPFARIN